MRYTDTRSVSQRQTLDDESYSPPRNPLSAISLPPPAGLAEPASTQVKTSWFSFNFPPPQRNAVARTSLSGITAHEEEANTTPLRLWSGPTSDASFSQAATIFECADSTPIIYHQSAPKPEIPRVWLHSSIGKWPEQSPISFPENRQHGSRTPEPLLNRLLTRIPKLSKFLDKQKFKNTLKGVGDYNSLDEFLHEDSKETHWASVNLRLPGSICAFCGSTFTGPGHLEDVSAHVRAKHCQPQQHQSVAPPPKRRRFHKHFTAFRNATQDGHSALKFDGLSKITHAQWSEVNTMGSWAHRDVLASRQALDTTPSTTHQHRIIECDNPDIPHDRLLFLLNSLDPSVNPKRANDFFNALDLILGNLLDKFPDDDVVLGIQSALARLEYLYGINFGGSVAGLSKSISTAASEGVKTCAGSQENSSSTDSSSDTPKAPSESNSQQNGNTDPSGPGEEDQGHPRNELRKAKRKHRSEDQLLLACPFRKNCEVHGLTLYCHFTGETTMSMVIQHLRGGIHSGGLGYLKLCRNCWQYVIDQEEYHNFHGSTRCNSRPQPRGPRVAQQWYSLYSLLFPHSDRIPSPYVGDMSSKPTHTSSQQHLISEEGEPEFNFNTFPTSQSFLEQSQPSVLNEVPPPMHNPFVQPQSARIARAEAGAMEFISQMFSEQAHHPYDLIDYYTSSLVDSASQLPPEDFNVFSGRIYARVDEMMNTVRARRQGAAAQNLNANTVNLQLPVPNMQHTHYFTTIPPDGQWVGQFPVPPHLRETHQRSILPPSEQPVWDPEISLTSYGEQDFMPGASDFNYSTFYPDMDHAQMFSGQHAGMGHWLGPQRVISA